MSTATRKVRKRSVDTKKLTGFVATDSPDGIICLCRTQDGDDCLEIHEDDVKKRKKVKGADGSKQTALFVDRQANIVRRASLRISREAEFLQGSLLAAFTDMSRGGDTDRSREILAQLYVAKSETTLTCWEDCTVHISACLAQANS